MNLNIPRDLHQNLNTFWSYWKMHFSSYFPTLFSPTTTVQTLKMECSIERDYTLFLEETSLQAVPASDLTLIWCDNNVRHA